MFVSKVFCTLNQFYNLCQLQILDPSKIRHLRCQQFVLAAYYLKSHNYALCLLQAQDQDWTKQDMVASNSIFLSLVRVAPFYPSFKKKFQEIRSLIACMNAELGQVAKLSLFDNSLLPIFRHLPRFNWRGATLNGTIFRHPPGDLNKLFKNVMNIAKKFRVLGLYTLFHLIFVHLENEHRQNEVRSLCIVEE